MLGLIAPPLPEELPAPIKRIAENIVDHGLPDPLPVLRLPALGEERRADGEGRVLAGVVEFEGAADEVGLCALGIDNPDFLLLLADTLVASTVIAWIPALLRFLGKSFLHFLGKVIAVLASEHDVDVPLELLVGFGIFMDDEALFHKVDLPLLIFIEPLVHIDGIAEVTGGTVHFLEEENLHLGMRLPVGNALRVNFPLDLPACGLGEDEALYDLEVSTQRVVLEEFHLRGERVAIVLLILGGDAGDEDGRLHGRWENRVEMPKGATLVAQHRSEDSCRQDRPFERHSKRDF